MMGCTLLEETRAVMFCDPRPSLHAGMEGPWQPSRAHARTEIKIETIQHKMIESRKMPRKDDTFDNNRSIGIVVWFRLVHPCIRAPLHYATPPIRVKVHLTVHSFLVLPTRNSSIYHQES